MLCAVSNDANRHGWRNAYHACPLTVLDSASPDRPNPLASRMRSDENGTVPFPMATVIDSSVRRGGRDARPPVRYGNGAGAASSSTGLS